MSRFVVDHRSLLQLRDTLGRLHDHLLGIPRVVSGFDGVLGGRALEAELADARDKLLRALAEGENQRRRFVREREESLRYAAANFAKELLSVADNLRRAIASEAAISSDPAAKGVIEGVAATERELWAIFEAHGVKRVEPALGDPFDPHLHQAMYEVATGEHPPGTIAQLLQPGQQTLPVRTTANLLVSPFEGEGYSIVDGKQHDWKKFDTLAIPGGSWFEHHNRSADESLYLFVASDEPVLKKLGLYKKWGKDAAGATGLIE